jgi:phage gp36-like protein
MYITKSDIEKKAYPEVVAVMSRADTNIEESIYDAMAEVRSYLTARYDMDAEFAKSGAARNQMVKKLVTDIALWNIYSGSNPANMSEVRVVNYEKTVKLLRDMQAEKATIDGLQRKDAATGSNYVNFKSNPKRTNHY